MADILLQKSAQNNTALIYLIERELFAPAIHCGYYSCMQKLMYILEEYYDVTPEKVNDLVRSRGSSHGHYIREIYHYLIRRDKGDARTFNRKMLGLKELRLSSDYRKEEIDQAKAEKAHEYVSSIHRIIKKHMEL